MNNQQNRNFEEVQGGAVNPQWKPQATEKNGMVFNPNSPTNILEGYYLSSQEIKGQQDRYFTVVTIRTMNPDGSFGEDFDVIGDTVLNDRLSKIAMNSYVRLEYQGRVHKKGYPPTSPWSQTNSFHSWKVLVDKNAVPLDQLLGHKTNPAAQQNNFNAAAQNHQQAPVQNSQVFNQQAPVSNPPVFQQQAPVFNQQQQAPVFQQNPPVFNQQATVQNQGQFVPSQNQPVNNGQNQQNQGQQNGGIYQHNGDLQF